MQPYDILFFKSTDLLGKLIATFTRSKYCHVGILMPDKKTLFDINIGKRSNIVKLVNIKNIEAYRVNGIIYGHNVDKWIINHFGLKYDIGEVIKCIMGINTPDDDNKFICSSLVLDFLKNCTNVKIPPNTYIVSPQDLIDLNLLHRV